MIAQAQSGGLYSIPARRKRRTPERSLLERFEEKFVPEPNSGCWLWLAACNKDRYGRESYGVIGKGGGKRGGNLLAHRAAWLLYRGELPPDDLDVRHTCDNRLCVNPDHLVLGTRLENMRDAVERGRTFGGAERAALTRRLWQQNYKKWFSARPRGEGHANAKLTTSDMVEIRQSALSSSVLAARLGVSVSTVSRARRGETWQSI